MNDKKQLLKNMILRMYKSGYLDKSDRSKGDIEHVTFLLNSDEGYKPVLTFTYDYPVIDSPAFLCRDLEQFIKAYYDAIAENKDPYKLLYSKKRTRTIDKFDIDTKRFLSKQNLVDHCAKMVFKEPELRSEIEDFYKAYVRRWFPKAQKQIEFNQPDIVTKLSDKFKVKKL